MILLILVGIAILCVCFVGGPDTRTQEQKDYDEGFAAGMQGGPFRSDNVNYMNGFIDGENEEDDE